MKRELLLFLIIFSLGVFTTYSYTTKLTKDKLAANKEITLGIIDNCTAAFKIQDELVSNRSEAYEEIATCLLGGNCNPNQTATRLNDLNHEKGDIELELKDLVKDMDFIIGKQSSTL